MKKYEKYEEDEICMTKLDVEENDISGMMVTTLGWKALIGCPMRIF